MKYTSNYALHSIYTNAMYINDIKFQYKDLIFD